MQLKAAHFAPTYAVHVHFHSIVVPYVPATLCALLLQVWRALDVRYDQCIGHCDCIPERDMPDTHITVHFRRVVAST